MRSRLLLKRYMPRCDTKSFRLLHDKLPVLPILCRAPAASVIERILSSAKSMLVDEFTLVVRADI